MNVALITSTISGQAIDILSTFNVPNVDSFGSVNRDWDWVIVFANCSFVELNVFLISFECETA